MRAGLARVRVVALRRRRGSLGRGGSRHTRLLVRGVAVPAGAAARCGAAAPRAAPDRRLAVRRPWLRVWSAAGARGSRGFGFSLWLMCVLWFGRLFVVVFWGVVVVLVWFWLLVVLLWWWLRC